MSLDTQAFREKYRASVAPYYNPWWHGGFVLATGLAVIAYLLSTLREVSAPEWLTVPLALVFYSWGEYNVHKRLGHHKHPMLRMFYQRHTGDHHAFFADDHMRYDYAKDWRVILFPAWLIVLYGAGALLVWWLLRGLNANASALFAATLVSGYLAYEFLHACEHLPPANPLCRLPWIRQVRRLHQLHHRRALMQTHNFNVTFPLWDWLLGTLHWEAEPAKQAPGTTMRHAVEIPRAPAAVLDYVSTPRRWHEWHHYPVAITGPEGALPVGARFAYVGGRAGALQWEVVAVQPGVSWQARACGRHGLELLVTYECIGTPSGTRFVRTLEYRFGSLFARLADRLFIGRRIESDSIALVANLGAVAGRNLPA